VGVAGKINLGVGWRTKRKERVSGIITTDRNPGCLGKPVSLPKSIRQKNQYEIYLDFRRCGGKIKQKWRME